MSQHTSVIPTRVGMVRVCKIKTVSTPRDPHARGDGPGGHVDCRLVGGVIPTRVGMVRPISPFSTQLPV